MTNIYFTMMYNDCYCVTLYFLLLAACQTLNSVVGIIVNIYGDSHALRIQSELQGTLLKLATLDIRDSKTIHSTILLTYVSTCKYIPSTMYIATFYYNT